MLPIQLLPIRIEHFGRWLGHISFNWCVRSWGYVAHVRRAVSAIGGRRRDGGGTRYGCYAAGEPVLRLRQGQVLVRDATCWRIAISRSVKTVSSGRSLKSVATTAGSKVSVLAELVIILTTDRVAVIVALNRLRDQIFVNGTLRVLITAIAAAMDVRRFRRWRN